MFELNLQIYNLLCDYGRLFIVHLFSSLHHLSHPAFNYYNLSLPLSASTVSPPLPPPPESDGGGDHFAPPPPPPTFEHGYGMHGGGPGSRRPQMVEDPGPYGTPIPRYAMQSQDEWVPKTYIEKGECGKREYGDD